MVSIMNALPPLHPPKLAHFHESTSAKEGEEHGFQTGLKIGAWRYIILKGTTVPALRETDATY